MLNMGLGETLYESGDIAFDTNRLVYFNPITNTDYGVQPPSGGWPIRWYGTLDDIHVPIGPGVVAKSEAEATAMKATILAQLIDSNNKGSQYHDIPEAQKAVVRSQVSALMANTGNSVNANTQSSLQGNNFTNPVTSIISYLQNNELFGIKDSYLAIGVALIGGYMMFGSGGSGRRRR